jgi:transposase InsO family protein
MSQQSLGRTVPLLLTPVLVMDFIQYAPSIPPHAFEVLDLDVQQYQFIIGKDLLPILFPNGIPIQLFCPIASEPMAGLMGDGYTLRNGQNTNINPANPCNTLATASTHINAPLSPNHISSTQLPTWPFEGEGHIAASEQPTRVATSTPSELEQEYSNQRERIMNLPHIMAARNHNEAITGFCNIPEAILKLKLDPERGSPTALYARQYPLSQRCIEAAEPVIKRWLDTGRIVPAPPGCPYNNPLTVAPKKDDQGQLTGFRVCLDVRRLNLAIIEMDQFQIPIIREVLNNLQGCTIFAEFDLAEAYLQFPLHPESQPLTAFTWGHQQYMFAACPFGLCNMPSHFQRIIQYVFRDITATIPYFDNIPFGSHNWDEHATHVFAIIETCNKYNLKIKPSSIKIGQAQLNCLGHLITPQGIRISHDKLIKVEGWPLPRTGKQLASFLGLITFIRQHIRHFSDLTAEFESLKRTTGIIEWTPERLHKLQLLRHAINHAPLLIFPDFNKTFYVATDASCLGIGGVLYQPTESDKEDITSNNIVAICSKKLNECQQRYSTYKKELFAIIYCLRQFHSYIWGHKIVLITDHLPLVYLLTSSRLAHALQQWLDVVLDYQFTIKHRPGILHVLPDALSRLYELNYDETWGVPSKDPYELIKKHSLPIDKDTLLLMSKPPPLVDMKSPRAPLCKPTYSRTVATAHSTNNSQLQVNLTMDDTEDPMERKYDEPQSSTSDTNMITTEPAPLPIATDELKIAAAMEYRGKTAPPTQQQKEQLIMTEHAQGHFGREAIYRSLYKKGYWWPKIRQDIQNQIRNCVPCLRHVIAKTGFDPSSPITAALPWDHVQMDFIVKLTPSKPDGFTSITVLIDVCSGYLLLRPSINTQVETIAPILWQVFNDFGFPRILQSDNDPTFTSAIIQEMARIAGIDYRFITPYHPRADGKVEKNIGTAKEVIKKHLLGTYDNWPMFVPWAQSCINNKISQLTGSTPFSLMFGRRFNGVNDYSHDSPLEVMNETEWARVQDRMISIIYPTVAERVALQKDLLKKRMDKRQRAVNFKKGDIVMLKRHERVMNQPLGTFEAQYVGPYMIESKSRMGAITLITPQGTPLPRMVRSNQLKFVSHFNPEFKENVWEVDRIVDHRGEGDNREYKVHWKGYSSDEDTWEPISNLFDAEWSINNYLETLPPTQSARRSEQ